MKEVKNMNGRMKYLLFDMLNLAGGIWKMRVGIWPAGQGSATFLSRFSLFEGESKEIKNWRMNESIGSKIFLFRSQI